MGQILHGSATTTHAVRAAIQRSQASASELSRTYGFNVKTVLEWRNRATVEDRRTGPREPHSTVLSRDEEAIIVAFILASLVSILGMIAAMLVVASTTSSSSRRMKFG